MTLNHYLRRPVRTSVALCVLLLSATSSMLWTGVAAQDACCPSGYSGADCLTAADQTCLDNAIEPSIYSTLAATSLSSVSYVSDSLVMAISAPIVKGRVCSSITLGSASTPGSDPKCTTFAKSLVNDPDCLDSWSGSISWSDARTLCGFVLDTDASTSSTQNYVGFLTVQHNDSIPNVEGWRTQKSVFPIHVVFPSLLNVSNVEIRVDSPIAITAFLNDQSYSPAAGQATLTFNTIVPYPYTLSSGSIQVAATQTLVTFTETTASTPCSGSGPCQQEWQVIMSPQNAVCVLDGDYDISVIPACRVGVINTASCPYPNLQADDTPSHIVASLVSDSFCPMTEVSISVTPSLAAVSGRGGSTQKVNYLLDYPVYFVFSVVSPQAAIRELSLSQVTVHVPGSADPVSVLYTNLGPTTLGTDLEFNQKNANMGSTSLLPFEFVLDSSIFQAGPLEVQAAVTVTYSANNKRSVMYTFGLDQRSMNQTANIAMEQEQTNNNNNNNNNNGQQHLTSAAAAPSCGITCIVAMTVAVVMAMFVF